MISRLTGLAHAASLQHEITTSQLEKRPLSVMKAAYSARPVWVDTKLPLNEQHQTCLDARPSCYLSFPSLCSFRWLAICLLSCLCVSTLARAEERGILASIRDRGHVICGTANDEVGFSEVSSDGKWSGLYIDLCKAIGVAVLDDPEAAKFVPLVGTQRFRALADGKIDVLARNTAWTTSRDLQGNVRFAGPLFYDGKSFLIRKSSGILSALELSGADICLIEGGLTETSVSRYFSTRGMQFNLKKSETWTGVLENYNKENCLVLAADSVQLSFLRNSLPNKNAHSLLPEVFDVDAFGPYVQAKDESWRQAVAWIIHALVIADEQGVTRDNVERLKASADNRLSSVLVIAEAARNRFGFVESWFSKLIGSIGSYSEVFDRNLGSNSRVGLSRGPNKPVSQGGLLRAPALR